MEHLGMVERMVGHKALLIQPMQRPDRLVLHPLVWFSRTKRALSHSMEYPLPQQVEVGAPKHLSLN